MDFINQIDISNFKSIKNLSIKNCKRINLFVGTPNAGKSNLLEAMSLAMNFNSKLFPSLILNKQIRITNATEIFNYGNINQPVSVSFNNSEKFEISYRDEEGYHAKYNLSGEEYFNNKHLSLGRALKIDEKFRAGYSINERKSIGENVYKYKFENLTNYSSNKENANWLLPVFGENLSWVLENGNSLKEYFFDLINEFGLKFYIKSPENSIMVYKELSQFNIFNISYDLIPDTIQRLLFYHTAIETNQNSILLFEEPEAHMFPPYISKFTGDIIKNETNQYFIATHSPYVIDDFLSDSMDELAIHLLYFEDGETKAYTLSSDNLDTLYQNGSNAIFLNLDRFRKNEN
jgi:predicted ATP-dependent endonuclease of OLD family